MIKLSVIFAAITRNARRAQIGRPITASKGKRNDVILGQCTQRQSLLAHPASPATKNDPCEPPSFGMRPWREGLAAPSYGSASNPDIPNCQTVRFRPLVNLSATLISVIAIVALIVAAYRFLVGPVPDGSLLGNLALVELLISLHVIANMRLAPFPAGRCLGSVGLGLFPVVREFLGLDLIGVEHVVRSSSAFYRAVLGADVRIPWNWFSADGVFAGTAHVLVEYISTPMAGQRA